MLDLALPEDVIREILFRIPFVSILACKLVSKQWKNVINNPSFYCRYRNTSVGFFLRKIGFYCLLTRYKMGLTYDQPFPSYTRHRIPIELGLNEQSTLMDIHRFDLLPWLSHGIACVTEYNGYGPFKLFNLFTGASYNVEISPLVIQQQKVKCSIWGFGYDFHANDYKIFRRYHYSNKPLITTSVDNDVDSDEFWIYSFKDESWKQVNGFPEYYWPSYEGRGCSFNGALHWVAVDRDTKKRVVVTYDLRSVKFGQVLLPTEGCYFRDTYYTTGRLSELNGQLCYVYEIGTRQDFSFPVWVMKEYGCWTKLLALDHLTTQFFRWSVIYQATPVALHECRDGRKAVLFSSSSCPRLFWYDPDNGRIRGGEVNNIYI